MNPFGFDSDDTSPATTDD